VVALAKNRPSALERVICCPGSRRLVARAPQGVPSKYAELGTAAHSLAERCLLDDTTPAEHFGDIIRTYPVDNNMAGAVTKFVQHVRRERVGALEWGVEERIDVPDLDMPDGGTIDSWVWAPPVLKISDYKHGEGKVVEIADRNAAGDLVWLNAQMGAYAWAKLREIEKRHGMGAVQTIHATIGQPRAWHREGGIRTVVLQRGELFNWLTTVAFPRVAQSQSPDAPLVPGPHCKSTFCPAIGMCTARARTNLLAASPEPRPNVRRDPIFPTYTET